MALPEGHTLGPDARPFLEVMRQQIEGKLQAELRALKSVKFQLALKIQLRKSKIDGSVEYTDPLLRHKQETLLQESEISEALDKYFYTILCSITSRRPVPVPKQRIRTVQDYQKEIFQLLEEQPERLEFHQTP